MPAPIKCHQNIYIARCTYLSAQQGRDWFGMEWIHSKTI